MINADFIFQSIQEVSVHVIQNIMHLKFPRENPGSPSCFQRATGICICIVLIFTPVTVQMKKKSETMQELNGELTSNAKALTNILN